MPIKVELNTEIRQCDHCGAKNILRTFKISGVTLNPIYIGRVCLGKALDINTSGNYYHACERAKHKLNLLDQEGEDVYDLLVPQ